MPTSRPTPSPFITVEEKAAPAWRARENDHVCRDRDTAAPRARQLQFMPWPRQQGYEGQRPPSPLVEVFVPRGWHGNTSAVLGYEGGRTPPPPSMLGSEPKEVSWLGYYPSSPRSHLRASAPTWRPESWGLDLNTLSAIAPTWYPLAPAGPQNRQRAPATLTTPAGSPLWTFGRASGGPALKVNSPLRTLGQTSPDPICTGSRHGVLGGALHVFGGICTPYAPQ